MLPHALQFLTLLIQHHPTLVGAAAASTLLALLQRKRTACHAGQERLRRLHEQLTTLCRAELPPPGSHGHRTFAMQVCRLVCSSVSVGNAALLLPSPAGDLAVAGRIGVDDLCLQALESAAARLPSLKPSGPPERPAPPHARRLPHHNAPSLLPSPLVDGFVTRLERRSSLRPGEPSGMGCRDALILPLWSSSGDLLGALCALGNLSELDSQVTLRDTSASLRVLALRLSAALEIAQLSDRLQHAERSGGRSQPVTNPRPSSRDLAYLPSPAARPDHLHEVAPAPLRQPR